MENKSRIGKFALCFFAAIPGAGHMYLGLMKTGAVHMGLFVGAFALGNILYFDLFYYAMIILWFYSFFDVYRLERLSGGGEAPEDEIAFLKAGKGEYTGFLNKHGRTVGIVCVAVGAVYLIRDVLIPYLYHYELSEKVSRIIQDISTTLPQVIGGVLIIVLGVWLIRGKSRELKGRGQQKEE